jgi:hypothetical protein
MTFRRFAAVPPGLLILCCALYAAPLKVLFVNNSLTYFNNLPGLIDSLGMRANPPLDIRCDMHSIPGSELTEHLTPECLALIRDGDYDFVVLQGYMDAYLYPERFYAAARQLNDSILKAGAQTAFYMTWPWASDSASLFDTCIHSYDSIGAELRAPVAPVGRVFRQLLSCLSQQQVYGDGVHPTGAMSYMAACVIFATLTGRNPVGNSFDPVVTPFSPSNTWSCDSGGPALQRLSWETARLYNGLPRPVFAPERQTFWEPITISLTVNYDSAIIRYTLDGTEPTASSTIYAAPVPISATTTISAVAFKDGFRSSFPAVHTYRLIDPPVLTSIAVAPHSRWVLPAETRRFSAAPFDQYGDTMDARLAWAVSGGGSIDSTGLFAVGGTPGPRTITASGNGISRSFDVVVGQGDSLPGGYLQGMLMLQDSTGSCYLPTYYSPSYNLIGIDQIGVPVPGKTQFVDRIAYRWTWATSPDGWWAQEDRNFFDAYFAVTIVSQASRMLRIAYRAGGSIRFWCNDSIIDESDSLLRSTTEVLTKAFPINQGRNCVILRLHDWYDSNSLAVRFTDSAGDTAHDLWYFTEGDLPTKIAALPAPIPHGIVRAAPVMTAGRLPVVDLRGRIVSVAEDREAIRALRLPPGVYLMSDRRKINPIIR